MDDEDDDGNFTNWMSSYWGHGAGEGRTKDRKRSLRKPARSLMDRRASLPCPSQLNAMQLNRLHASSQPPSPVHRTKEEKDVRVHSRARRASSDDNHRKPSYQETRITTIPELTESFERRLRFRNKKSDKDNFCLICHEEMRNSGGVQELHCTHRFHKECMEQWLWKKLWCPTCRLHVVMSQPLYWSSAHIKMP